MEKTEIELFISTLFEAIPELAEFHLKSSSVYRALDQSLRKFIKESPFADRGTEPVRFGPFGSLIFPYNEFGKINSLDLFGLDELIIFKFYNLNKSRYSVVADMGANIGLHSVLMAKCGYTVHSYEPDPLHVELLKSNLEINEIKSNVTVHQKAVADFSGKAEFLRINHNTTSSHLSGSKKAPYGDIDHIEVDVVDIKTVVKDYDLIKMDVEGQEANIIAAICGLREWNTDMMLEVGSPENASLIFENIQKNRLCALSQKTGWKRVRNLIDLPTSYREGSLFISSERTSIWD